MRRCAPSSAVPTEASRGASFYEPRLSVAVELLLFERRLPSSTNTAIVLFLGRKVYFAAVVVLVSVLRQGPTPMKISQLEELVGASAQTIHRWRRLWLETFGRSRFWAAARAHFRTPVDEKSLPLALLQAFDGEGEQVALVRLLCFLRPLTLSTARDF